VCYVDVGPSGVSVDLTGFVALQRKVKSKVFPAHALIVCSVRRVTAPVILFLVSRSR
jgi:hypothetical protein